MPALVGTAGWAIGKSAADSFPETGSSLERYAAIFPVVEINSSFHRAHRLSTWQRWRDTVPRDFRFSVKLPKTISHERKLVDCDDLLELFLDQVRELGDKLGVLLLQLPPKLEFHEKNAERFLANLISKCPAPTVCEPRHASWFEPQADALLNGMRVARVGADPARHPGAGYPGGWRGLSYFRWHGSPAVYRSSYADRIPKLAEDVRREAAEGGDVWCIFDNTASSAASADGLMLMKALASNT